MMKRILATDWWRQQDPVFTIGDPASTFSRSYTAYRHYPIGDVSRLESIGNDILRCSWQKADNGLWVRGAHLEPGRTNVLIYNCEIDNAAWTKRSCTISDTKITLPTGDESYYDIVKEATNTDLHYINRLAWADAGITTMSCYIYPINRDKIQLSYGSQGSAKINIATKEVIPGVAETLYGSIYDLKNGLYRVQMTFNHVGGTSFAGFGVLDNNLNISFTGNGLDAFGLWGLQLESGEYASSLIITGAAAASRTEDSDWQVAGPLPSMQQGWISGKFYITPHTNSAEIPILTLSDGGGAADRIRLAVNTSGNLEVQSACTGGDAGLVEGSSIMDGRVEGHHWYITFRPGELCLAVDGDFGASDHVVTIPDNLDTLQVHPSGGIVGDIQVGDKFSRVPPRFLAAA